MTKATDMISEPTGHRPVDQSRRTSAAATWGVALAIVAQASSIALLATSGWFLAACAVAGVFALTTFSYILPSAFVQLFAALRIVAHYGQQVFLHDAALRRVARQRVGLFRTVARRAEIGRDVPAEKLLDVALADTETSGMRLISVVTPRVVFVSLWVIGGLVVARVDEAAGLVALLGAALVVALAGAVDRRISARGEERTGAARGSYRALLVGATAAQEELISLGAGARVLDELGASSDRQLGEDATFARRSLLVDLALGVCFTLLTGAVVTLTVRAGAPVTEVSMVALLMVGLAATAQPFQNSHREARKVAAAERKLTAGAGLSAPGAERARGAAPDGPSAERASRSRAAEIVVPQPGGCAIVTGPSGSGKTTALVAFARERDARGLDNTREAREGRRAGNVREGREGRGAAEIHASSGQLGDGGELILSLVEDYVFSGSVAENLAIGDAKELDRTAARAALDEFGLGGIGLDEEIGTGNRPLSGGEKTRLRLARVALAQPALALIDEPTVGLDRDTARRALCALHDELPNSSVVLALHDPELALEVWPDANIMRIGRSGE